MNKSNRFANFCARVVNKEFFANTKARFKGKLGQAFLATLISVLPFAAIIFAAAWLTQLVHGLFGIILILAIVLFGNMQVGHIKFIRKLNEGDEAPSIKLLFSGFTGKNMIMYTFLGIIVFLIYLFSGILLFVPLLFAIGSYSMVFYFVEHHDYDHYLDALSTSAKQMKRHRVNMYAYKLWFYLAYILSLALFLFLLLCVDQIATVSVSIMLMVVLHVLLYLLFSFITTIYSLCNFNYFIEVLDYNDRKRAKAMPEVKETVKKEEELVKVSAEEQKVEKPAVKKAAPKTTTKTTTAKTTTAKKTTATKAKPAAKKED